MDHLSGLKFMCALAGIANTDAPEWLHIQDFPINERLKPIMASAAIPLVFAPQQIGDTMYMDGGMADWIGETGNTPVPPLADSGCDVVVTILLNRVSMFNRLRQEQVSFIEIRPEKRCYANHSLKTIISFDKTKILNAIEDGYDDARKKIGQIQQALSMVEEDRKAFKELEKSVAGLDDSRAHMQDMMKRLGKRS